MIYKLRLWISKKLFIYGKHMHPEIGKLLAEIKESQSNMKKQSIFISKTGLQVKK